MANDEYIFANDSVAFRSEPPPMVGSGASGAVESRVQVGRAKTLGPRDRARATTVEAWCEAWLRRRKLEGGGDVDTRERPIVRMFITGTDMGKKLLSELTRSDVREWWTWMHTQTVRTKQWQVKHADRLLSYSRMGNVLVALRQALGEAFDEGLIAENFAEGLRVHRSRKGKTKLDTEKVLTVAEQLTVLWSLSLPTRLWAMVSLGTGIRKGEQWALRWTDVDVESSRPSIVVRYGKRGKGTTKTKKPRRVPLLPLALHALRAWKKIAHEHYPHNPLDLVFPGQDGAERRVGSHASREVQRIGKLIGRHFTWHNFRHSCGTSLAGGWWGDEPWKLEALRVFYGHSSVSMTEHYAKLAEELAFAAAFGREEGYGSSALETTSAVCGSDGQLTPQERWEGTVIAMTIFDELSDAKKADQAEASRQSTSFSAQPADAPPGPIVHLVSLLSGLPMCGASVVGRPDGATVNLDSVTCEACCLQWDEQQSARLGLEATSKQTSEASKQSFDAAPAAAPAVAEASHGEPTGVVHSAGDPRSPGDGTSDASQTSASGVQGGATKQSEPFADHPWMRLGDYVAVDGRLYTPDQVATWVAVDRLIVGAGLDVQQKCRVCRRELNAFSREASDYWTCPIHATFGTFTATIADERELDPRQAREPKHVDVQSEEEIRAQHRMAPTLLELAAAEGAADEPRTNEPTSCVACTDYFGQWNGEHTCEEHRRMTRGEWQSGNDARARAPHRCKRRQAGAETVCTHDHGHSGPCSWEVENVDHRCGNTLDGKRCVLHYGHRGVCSPDVSSRFGDVMGDLDHDARNVRGSDEASEGWRAGDVPERSAHGREAQGVRVGGRGGAARARLDARDGQAGLAAGASVVGGSGGLHGGAAHDGRGANDARSGGGVAGSSIDPHRSLRAQHEETITELESYVVRLTRMNESLVRELENSRAMRKAQSETLSIIAQSFTPAPGEVVTDRDRAIALAFLESRRVHVYPELLQDLAAHFAQHRIAAVATSNVGERYRATIGLVSDMRQSVLQFVERAERRLAEYANTKDSDR